MATHRLGLVMHGVTGRMGLNQHLKRSILAIRGAGGVALQNGDRVVPDPLLLGRNDRKLGEIARETGLDAYTTDYDAAIQSAEHSLFFDAGATLMRPALIGKAIAAGKHVYCEKPVAGSLAAAVEVCEQAEAAGVKAGVVMDKLFLPGLIKLARLKTDGSSAVSCPYGSTSAIGCSPARAHPATGPAGIIGRATAAASSST